MRSAYMQNMVNGNSAEKYKITILLHKLSLVNNYKWISNWIELPKLSKNRQKTKIHETNSFSFIEIWTFLSKLIFHRSHKFWKKKNTCFFLSPVVFRRFCVVVCVSSVRDIARNVITSSLSSDPQIESGLYASRNGSRPERNRVKEKRYREKGEDWNCSDQVRTESEYLVQWKWNALHLNAGINRRISQKKNETKRTEADRSSAWAVKYSPKNGLSARSTAPQKDEKGRKE